MSNLAENNLIPFPGSANVPQTSPKREEQKKKSVSQIKHSKNHVAYWKTRVYNPSSKGGEGESADYCVKIQYGKRRHTFSLKTAEVSEAAARSRDIYISIVSEGWDETLLKYRPGWEQRVCIVTFGDYFEELEKYSTLKPRMIALYRSKVFCLLPAVAKIKGMKGWKARCGEARERWVRKLSSLKLVEISDDQIAEWQTFEIRKVQSNPLKVIARTRTLNTNLRALKSIFSRKHLKRLSHLKIPEKLPGLGVSYLEDRPNRYRSKIDATELTNKAIRRFLHEDTEVLKAFFLSLFGGLRRSESDFLMWRSFDWDKNRIYVETHEYHDLKTAGSEDFVHFAPTIMKFFRDQFEKRNGEFVLESHLPPRRHKTKYSYYRAKKTWESLISWLRKNGLDVQNPVHTLRKECGSLIAQQAGIHAASRALRHSGLQITESVYIDMKEKSAVGIEVDWES